MIEQFCSKKRMIVSIILLGLLTVLFLILEEALTEQEHTPTPTPKNNNLSYQNVNRKNIPLIPNLEQYQKGVSEKLDSKSEALSSKPFVKQPCWLTESFTIIEPCSPCSHFEIESGSKPACVETGLKEEINCNSKGLVYRSCSRIPEVEKRRFLIFESLMLLFTVLSYGLVKLRTSQLERMAAKQIEKRLAASY